MLNKFGFQLIALLILFAIILVIPVDVVWGGQNFQTIPTIGPTRTSTATTISSTTQPVKTQQPNQTATSTKTVSITLIFTVDPTIQKTNPLTTAIATEMLLKPEESAPTEAKIEQAATQSVLLPLVSSGAEAQSDLIEKQNNEEDTPIPAFVFPVLIVLILLIFYYIIRMTIKKPQNNHPPK